LSDGLDSMIEQLIVGFSVTDAFAPESSTSTLRVPLDAADQTQLGLDSIASILAADMDESIPRIHDPLSSVWDAAPSDSPKRTVSSHRVDKGTDLSPLRPRPNEADRVRQTLESTGLLSPAKPSAKPPSQPADEGIPHIVAWSPEPEEEEEAPRPSPAQRPSSLEESWWKRRCSAAEDERDAMRGEMQRLSASLGRRLKGSADRQQALEGEVAELKKHLATALETAQRERERGTAAEEQLHRLQEAHDRLQRRQASATKAIEGQDEAMAALRASAVEAESANGVLRARVSELKRQLQEQQSQSEALQARHYSLEDELRRAASVLREAEQAQLKGVRAVDRAAAAEARAKEIEGHFRSASVEWDKFRSELESKIEDQDRLIQSLRSDATPVSSPTTVRDHPSSRQALQAQVDSLGLRLRATEQALTQARENLLREREVRQAAEGMLREAEEQLARGVDHSEGAVSRPGSTHRGESEAESRLSGALSHSEGLLLRALAKVVPQYRALVRIVLKQCRGDTVSAGDLEGMSVTGSRGDFATEKLSLDDSRFVTLLQRRAVAQSLGEAELEGEAVYEALHDSIAKQMGRECASQ
jgi:hypothetical protein